MIYIDVTRLIGAHLDCEHEAHNLSGSQAELGRDAARITWRNSLAAAPLLGTLSEDELEEIRDHFKAYGAWDSEEIDTWGEVDLAAMVAQEVAAEIRRLEWKGIDLDAFTEAELEKATEAEGGRLWGEPGGPWSFLVGE